MDVTCVGGLVMILSLTGCGNAIRLLRYTARLKAHGAAVDKASLHRRSTDYRGWASCNASPRTIKWGVKQGCLVYMLTLTA